MGSTMMDDYEQQYSVLSAEITALIGKLALVEIGEKINCNFLLIFIFNVFLFLCARTDDRRNLIVDITRLFDETQDLLEQMELEISQNSNASQKAS
jgi:hypothetical protein